MRFDPAIETAALDWVIRQRDPAFTDWDGFADWLDAGPEHPDAYHALAALDADLADLPARSTAEVAHNDNIVPLAPRRANRRLWLGGALAACLVAIVSVGLLQRAPDEYRIETAMGEPQEVMLPDGSRIAINGGSAIRLSHADPRRATLEHGQALFSVRHRDDAPFRVSVGGAELVDVGTVFDVTRGADRTVVAVSEGAVVYNPRGANVRVDAGHRLALRDGSSAPQLSAVNNEAVGGWHAGQLVYDGVPLGDVAAEVSRTTGIAIRTAPGAASVLFRGALQTDTGDAGAGDARLVGDLAAMSGTRLTQDAGGWTLSR